MRETYKGMIIKTANSTGGKAGKGHNETSTIQVINPNGNFLVKHFRFNVGSPKDLAKAYRKAKDFVDNNASTV